MWVIDTPETLAAFRAKWSASRLLSMVVEHKRVFINWSVGVGKSYVIDDLIQCACLEHLYDIVIVMLPTRKVLKERRWVRNPPPDVNVINLRPRPANLCGPTFDAQLKSLEQRGMTLLGRVLICRSCPQRAACFWPRQYGRYLKGADVIFGTQAHLERDPAFIDRIQGWTGAKKPLLLLDEANFTAKSRKMVISNDDLVRYIRALDRIDGKA